MARLIILSGPSCVGKGPLITAVGRFYPHLAGGWKKLVLHTSRAPRPGEQDGVDYHFRNRAEIEGFREDKRYLVAAVRGGLQAINLPQLREDLQQGDVFFEGNPLIVEALLKQSQFQDIPRLSIFLSPLSDDEIVFLQSQHEQVNLHDFVTDVMRRKLLRRTTKQKTHLSLKDLEDIERRAGNALAEMRFAPAFDFVIANHDGEDSDHWDAFYFPIGDARKTLDCFAALLQGQLHPFAKRWDAELFNDQDMRL